MPRKNLIRDNIFPYHVINRTRNHEFYELSLDQMWTIYVDLLRIATWAFGAKIHAFVLMSNHYHLLLSTPDLNLDHIMRYIQSEVSRSLFLLTNNKKNYFDTRYKWSIIKEKSYFYNVYRYIYQNPLRAGISQKVNAYPYSTFHGRAGYSKLEVPLSDHFFIEDPSFINSQYEETWLNELIATEDLETIRKGIKHREFAIAKTKKLTRPRCL
jgi:putative transposase